MNILNIVKICGGTFKMSYLMFLDPCLGMNEGMCTFGVEVFLSIILAERASCVSRSGTSGRTLPAWLCIISVTGGSPGGSMHLKLNKLGLTSRLHLKP